MKNDLGKMLKTKEGFQVQFIRIYNHSIQDVWAAITQPEKLSIWFTDIEMEFRTGGKMTLYFRDDAKTATSGEIVEIKPPHSFAFTWEGELAEFELQSVENGKTRLTFTYSRIADDFALNVPSGFHILLDRLGSALEGNAKIYPFGKEEGDPAFFGIKDQYAEMICSEFPELEQYKPLVVERTYQASPERVWAAISEKDQMKQWYFTLDDFKAEVGFEFRFPGKGHKGESYVHVCTVTEVVPFHRLAYSWTYENHEGYSVISFDLWPEGDKTHVRLTHNGLHTFPKDNPDFAKSSFSGGWNALIGELLGKYLAENPA